METLKNWIEKNKTLAYILGGVLALLFVGKTMKPKPRRRRRTAVRVVNRPRKRVTRVRNSPKKRTTGAKKPWQIKGSLAAKRRMAQLRRMR